MTPEEALLEIGGLVDGAEIMHQLAGGPASDSYLIQRDEDRWVLRLDKPLAARLGLDRAAEAFALAHVYRDDASLDNIGPRLEYVDAERGIQLTRYLSGRAWTSSDLHDENNLVRVGRLLRSLHALDAPARPLNLRDQAGLYAGVVGTAEAASHVAEINARLERLPPAETCLCHNDLVAQNIIDGDRLYLIDWEYAALGDPFFDLAVIVQHHELAEEAARVLLVAYTGREADDDLRRLAVWCEIYEHLASLWQSVVDSAGC